MSRIDLGKGLVILPLPIAPVPAGGSSGNTASPVLPSGAGGGVANLSDTDSGEPCVSKRDHTVPPASNAWASSPRALRSDTGATSWQLTRKATAHLFGSPSLPYRRVDGILALPDQGSDGREPGGTSNSSGRT